MLKKTMQAKTLFIKDYMKENPICLTADIDILNAISLLLKHGISGAPIIDNKRRLLGILTERDCIKVAVNAGYFDDFGGQVSDYMTSNVETVLMNDNLMDVAQKLVESSFRRYPVVEKGILVGLITRRDILAVMENLSSN